MRIGSGLKSKTRLCRHFARNACEARLQGASLEASLHLNIPRFKSTESGETRWQVLHEPAKTKNDETRIAYSD